MGRRKILVMAGALAAANFIQTQRAVAASATPPMVHLATATATIFKRQKISVARYFKVPITVGTVDGWMISGTNALKTKDSPTDVACPVKLERDGTYAVFNDTGGFTFDIINTTQAYAALRTLVPQRVKLVLAITQCGSQSGSFNGCSDFPGSHIVMASSASITPVTLAHEFGHNQGINDVTGAATASRIMHIPPVAGRNEVTVTECRDFQK